MICNVSVSVAIFSVLVSVPTYRMEQVNPDALSLTVICKEGRAFL